MAQERQPKLAGGNEMTLFVGDKLLVSTRKLLISRPSTMFDYKCTGPYMVSRIIIKTAYKLGMPTTMQNHNDFHLPLLNCVSPWVKSQPCCKPHWVTDEKPVELEVDQVHNSRPCYDKVHYLIQCASYDHIGRGWQPADHIHNVWDLVDKFHWPHPSQPQMLGYRVWGWCSRAHRRSLEIPFVLLLCHSHLFRLDFGHVSMASAWGSPPNDGGGVSPSAEPIKTSPLFSSDWLWDDGVCIIVHIGWLFYWMFFFVSLILILAVQEVCT